ncbi:TIR domain-containing protein [Desulfosporosinus sp. PR]|uniref:TIR domain-containing protein n=1 Tax=Candidatus Desulfosporosinus nitrosoreducens TaxID=3401928 RepID=UPI0027F33BB2|nr:TIR domain-containing protein [Desulfosporosinus sp. PR]MDQ7095637.1 TIR domain-containing protein [Desulfosporosinus sp. PR]
MIDVFLAYTQKDIEKLNNIIDNLNSLNSRCNLKYYQPSKDKESVDFLNSLNDVYLFVVLLSDNSLKSGPVQLEISEAIRLCQLGHIKKICPIIIDENIDDFDSRIPGYIKQNIIYHASSQILAAQIIEEVVYHELSKA